MENYFILLIKPICISLIAIIIHEITHYIYAWKTGHHPIIEWEEGAPTVTFDSDMPKIDQLFMYGLAIFTGFLFINILMSWSINGYIYIVTIIIYLIGCGYDFQQLILIILKK
jgi:hypothetical protein